MKMVSMLILIMGSAVFLSGCSEEMARTGFLSDYSRLQKDTDSTLRYVNEPLLTQYSAFIVEPVNVYFPAGSESGGKLTQQQITDLAAYTHSKIVEAVQTAGQQMAQQPGPGVAKIRIALTDIEKTSAVNMLPQASLLGAGIGGASMEAEVVDSLTNQQIGAIVESGKGGRIPFTNLGDFTAAKNVINDWAERFQKLLQKELSNDL